jgi:hypothetical protein
MIEDMTIRNLSRSAQQSYICVVAKFNRSDSYVVTTQTPGRFFDLRGAVGVIAGLDGIIDVVLEFRREIEALRRETDALRTELGQPPKNSFIR